MPADVSDEECGRQFSVPMLEVIEILSLSGVGSRGSRVESPGRDG